MEKSFRNHSPKSLIMAVRIYMHNEINSNFTALFCATENCKQIIKTKEKTAKTTGENQQECFSIQK